MIELLNFYANRAFPMVFDDSLSMIELIGKLTAKVNELIEADNAYFSVDVRTNLKSILTEWQTDGTLNVIINEALTTRMDTLENSFTASRSLYGKRVVVIGDSVALGVSAAPEIVTANTWPNRFRDITGCTLDNRAVSGTCAATIGNPGKDVNAGAAIVDTAIFANADLVFVAYGINDYMQNVPIGKTDLLKTSFKGALSYMFGKINTVAPAAKIVCVTPLYGGGHNVKNSVGCFSLDYAEAMRQVAAAYNVPCIDLMHCMSTTDYNYGYAYFDGLYHPTEATYIRIGNYIANAYEGETGCPSRPLLYKTQAVLTGSTAGETAPAIAAGADQFVHMRGLIVANASNAVASINVAEHLRPSYDIVLPYVTYTGIPTWVKITFQGNIFFGVGGAVYDLSGVPAWYCGSPNVI